MSVITLYHYTDSKGCTGINKTKIILKSSAPGKKRDDAKYGDGVYFTSMSHQDHKKKSLAQNNYDGMTQTWERKMRENRLDYCIEVEMYTKNLERCESDRDIWLYTVGNLDLNGSDVKSYKGPYKVEW